MVDVSLHWNVNVNSFFCCLKVFNDLIFLEFLRLWCNNIRLYNSNWICNFTWCERNIIYNILKGPHKVKMFIYIPHRNNPFLSITREEFICCLIIYFLIRVLLVWTILHPLIISLYIYITQPNWSSELILVKEIRNNHYVKSVSIYRFFILLCIPYLMVENLFIYFITLIS